MNFSGNIIEEWLLSGKAVLKNLSCGNAGLVQIPVPEGKTYIITKIEILPFANIIDSTGEFSNPETFGETTTQNLRAINSRNQYQLLFWNERVNNTYNIRNEFFLSSFEKEIGDTMYTAPGNSFKSHIIDCFMLVESNSFLFLKYTDFTNFAPSITQSQLSNVSNINWPPSPYWGYSDQFDILEYNTGFGNAFAYTPQGLGTSYSQPPDEWSNQYTIPAVDLASQDPNFTTFIPPLAQGPGETGGAVTLDSLFSFPLYNIQYIEVNRRLSTTGLL